MFSDIAMKFQEITKFDLYSYFQDYADFMQNQYPDVRAYFAGTNESVNAAYMERLSSLSRRGDDLMKMFDAFGPKLGNVGYWELEVYCQDLNDTIKKIEILPKFLRTSKTPRGYKPFVQLDFNVGGLKDFKDIASQLNSDDITEESLILGNDFEESDYEIDTLKKAKTFYQNTRNVVVKTILEEPVGNKVYGRDILRKITFEDNDLKVVEYEDNVLQKVDILCELVQGDVPEFPTLGRRKTAGEDWGNYSYPELVRDLQATFMQDDLIDIVTVDNIMVENSDIFMTLNIQTKYVYSQKQTITI